GDDDAARAPRSRLGRINLKIAARKNKPENRPFGKIDRTRASGVNPLNLPRSPVQQFSPDGILPEPPPLPCRKPHPHARERQPGRDRRPQPQRSTPSKRKAQLPERSPPHFGRSPRSKPTR